MNRRIYLLTIIIFFGSVASGQPGTSKSWDSVRHIIYDGLKDRAGNLWFASSIHGVYRYDGKTFVNYNAKDGIGNSVTCLYEDRSGLLWLGTSAGVFQYNGSRFIRFEIPGPDSIEKATNIALAQMPRIVNDILEDKEGNFWFVTLEHGVYRFEPHTKADKRFTHFLKGEILNCVEEDKYGNILVGSWEQQGVYRYNKGLHDTIAVGKFRRLYGFSDDMIFKMKKDKQGNVWIGTRNFGIDCFDGTIGANGRANIRNFTEKNGYTSANVSAVFEDSKGNMWFGSDFNKIKSTRGDAYRYNGNTFTNVTADARILKFTDYNVRNFVEDNAGNIWIGSRQGMLLRYDGTALTDFSTSVEK